MSSEPHDKHPAAPVTPHPSNAAGACPPTHVWQALAADTLPEGEVLAYLGHASQCDACGALLREATTDFDEETTLEEAAFLNQLATSSAEGQQRLAEHLHAEACPPKRAPLLAWPPPRWAAIGLAAAVALVAAFVGYRVLRPASDATLLAQAYDKHRLTEMRIPGAKAVALASPTRGRSSNDTSSTELLQLKLRSQVQFEKTPNDAALRQTLGRIAIVEHDGEAARRQFEMAEALNPQSPGLKFDFATAYFVLAESNGKPLDYARAIDYFGQYLQSVQQKDAVALFDQGLCWERQNVDSEAIQDFEAALALEKDSGWRKEIARHLQTLKDRDAPSSGSAPKAADLTPAAFLAHPEDAPGQYETWLDVASREWLPHRGESPQTDTALGQLAAMGARHGDMWLGDMLKSSTSPEEHSAETMLSQSLQATARGNQDLALSASASSADAFRKLKNQPGYLRASVEHLHVLQRIEQSKDCLAEALPLTKTEDLKRYSWLRVDLQFEISSCHGMLGELRPALSNAETASEMASSASLPLAALRATNYIAAENLQQGGLSSAWSTAANGLAKLYDLHGADISRYQFLWVLNYVARDLNLRWTRIGAASAAAQSAAKSGHKRTGAYALEELALSKLDAGANDEAREDFQAADALMRELGSNVATSRDLADWETDRAVLHARDFGQAAALQGLASKETVFEHLDTFTTRLRYYTEYAELLRQVNRPQESLEKALKAVGSAEKMLPGIRSESQRAAWLENASNAYQVLTLDLIAMGRIDESLRAWQSFQATDYGLNYSSQAESAAYRFQTSEVVFPKQPVGRLTLVYARLQDHYVVWAVGGGANTSIQLKTLSPSAELIDKEGHAFRRLCADPHSSQKDIYLLGGSLFHDLIEPFEDRVDQASNVQFALDPSLSQIPFSALSRNGSFLGLSHAISFLPRNWRLTDANENVPTENTLSPGSRLLVLREFSPRPDARIPEEYNESSDIARQFPEAQIRSANLRLTGSALAIVGPPEMGALLEKADVVHYSGHGLNEDLDNTPPDSVSRLKTVELGQGTLKHCRLAVLAACRTLSERENSKEDDLSFERIVHSAGATHTIGTRWDVDSAMTHTLMVTFYAGLVSHQTFAEALRRAQQALQSTTTSSHPYYWSAFQLIGE